MPYVGFWAAMALGGYAMRIAYWSFVMLLFALILPFMLLYELSKAIEAKNG